MALSALSAVCGFLFQEDVSGGKRYFYIRAGLSLRDASVKSSYHIHDETFISFL